MSLGNTAGALEPTLGQKQVAGTPVRYLHPGHIQFALCKVKQQSSVIESHNTKEKEQTEKEHTESPK